MFNLRKLQLVCIFRVVSKSITWLVVWPYTVNYKSIVFGCGRCSCNTKLAPVSKRLVGWLCLTSHRQRGHLETTPPFTVPCEGREAR